MRRVHETEVGATGGQNSIDLVARGKVTTDHGTNACFVTYPVAQRGQEATTICRFTVHSGLARKYLDYITTMLLEGLRNGYRVLYIEAAFHTVCCRHGNRERLCFRPDCAHSVKHFQGVAHTVFQVSPVIVATPIREWREETGQQITMTEVELQHVDMGFLGHLRSTCKIMEYLFHVIAIHFFGNLALRRVWHGRGRE